MHAMVVIGVNGYCIMQSHIASPAQSRALPDTFPRLSLALSCHYSLNPGSTCVPFVPGVYRCVCVCVLCVCVCFVFVG